MNAIYRCRDERGQCYEFRGDTEDSYSQLKFLAESCFKVPVVDIFNEVRAETVDEEDYPETEFLLRGEEYKAIPFKVKQDKSAIFSEKAMMDVEVLKKLFNPEEATVIPLVELPEGEIEERVELVEEVRPFIKIEEIQGHEEDVDVGTLFG